jgi:hypothetical protein
MAGIAAVRLNLLRRPKPFRCISFPSHRFVYPPPSPEGNGGVEIRHSRCLKIDRIRQAVAKGSLRDIAPVIAQSKETL